MKHGFRARGVAAASLAFVSATAVPGPSGAIRANALPALILAEHVTARVAHDRTVDDPVSVNAGTGFARKAAPHAPATTVNQADKASRGPVRPRRSLRTLVEAHAAADVPDSERECLAVAVYFEAQGEPIEGQLAVAEVVLNRAASGEYPKSICEVVTQPAQFSFVRDGDFPAIDRRSHAWRKAVAVARIAAENLADTLSSDVLWYHADYVAPGWGRRLDRVTQIGAHIFYRRA